MKNTVDNIIMTNGKVVKTPLEDGVHGVTEGDVQFTLTTSYLQYNKNQKKIFYIRNTGVIMTIIGTMEKIMEKKLQKTEIYILINVIKM